MNKQELIDYYPSISLLKNIDEFCKDADNYPLYSQENEEDPVIIGIINIENGKEGEDKRGASFLLTEIQPLHDNGVSMGACDEYPTDPNIVCFGYSMTSEGLQLGYIHINQMIDLARIDGWNIQYFHIGERRSNILD